MTRQHPYTTGGGLSSETDPSSGDGNAADWCALPHVFRRAAVQRLREAVVRSQDEIVEAVASDTGKPGFEVLSQEVTPALEVMRYAARNVPRWLRPRRFWYPVPGFWTKLGRVEYAPLGTVAIIGPSNFPFSLPLMQTVYALLCGNRVALKPSEWAPATATVIETILSESGLAPDPVEVVQGGPDVVAELVADARVRKVFFTGSTLAGREVATLCGAHFKPCVLELGGCGHAIVCADADMKRAARGILWSAFYAGGRSCVGTRLALVEAAAWPSFIGALRASQAGLESEGLADERRAVIQGGGGVRLCPNDEAARPIEHGAPGTLTVLRVASLERALAVTNDCPSVLGASIWSRSPIRARAMARSLEAGIVWINDVGAGQPQLPWGGSRDCGWGRVFSRDSIHEFVNAKGIVHDLGPGQRKFWWYPYTLRRATLLRTFNRLVFGKKPRADDRRRP